ncbi:MAG: DMT family transporter [Actinomycetota bacterium]
MQAGRGATARGGPVTLVAFLVMCVFVGGNLVGVRFSNRELPPFWGATVRFAVATAILAIAIAVLRLPLPRGRELAGAIAYGLLAFALFFAFAYWALQELPTALAGVVFASGPLLTFFLALAHRQERFNMRSLIGGLLVIVGIAVMVRAPINASVPLVRLGAMLGAALCAAEAGIVGRHFRAAHPVVMNAIGMGVGTIFVGILSFITGELHPLPSETATLVSLAYLITLGSCGVFLLYLFVLKTWSASATSYEFVIAPLVAAGLAAWLLGERLTAQIAVGGAIVLVGVYVGAIATARIPEPDQIA